MDDTTSVGVNARDDDGRSALMEAAEDGNVEAIKGLLAKGALACVDLALRLAIENKWGSAAIFILQRLGDDHDAGNGLSGVSLFEAACDGGLAQVVEVLLVECADVAALDVSASLRAAIGKRGHACRS